MSTIWLIGSGPNCDLVVSHPAVSGRHCRLTREGDDYLLEDLGSTNGTYVNGNRLTDRVRVTPADTITLGHVMAMPWPAGSGGPRPDPWQARTLRIGREADNDIVVSLATVSAHHARLTWEGKPGELVIEDLGSSNGTAVGSPDRKVSRAVVSASETVYLGTHAIPVRLLLDRFETPAATTLVLRGDQVVIGRNPDCDQVADHASVSGRHARLFRSGARILVEDLGSTNGTLVNGERIDRPREVVPGDVITLGSHALVLDDPTKAPVPQPLRTVPELAAPIPAPAPAPIPAPVLPPTHSASDPAALPGTASQVDLAGALTGIVKQPRELAVLILQVPVIALAIVLALRTASSAPTIGSIVFWLGLAALWFGLSNAGLAGTAMEPRPGGSNPARLALRFGALAVLGLVQCVVAWLIVASGAGLHGSGPATLALLGVASAIGLALGLAIVLLAPRRPLAWVCLAAVLLPLWLFGGEAWPLPRMAPWARLVASVAPSRWVFEALLLVESEPRAAAEGVHGPHAGDTGARPADAPALAARPDPAEEFFPADTERMGLRADAIVLGGMLVGVLGMAAFISTDPKRAA
jgi:pSer/pThr/pTyr-binding forkhead associated (FHA) protein